MVMQDTYESARLYMRGIARTISFAALACTMLLLTTSFFVNHGVGGLMVLAASFGLTLGASAIRIAIDRMSPQRAQHQYAYYAFTGIMLRAGVIIGLSSAVMLVINVSGNQAFWYLFADMTAVGAGLAGTTILLMAASGLRHVRAPVR